MKTFHWRLHQKEVFMIFVGENFRQKLHKNLFEQVWGSWAKSFAPQKFACSYTYDQRHLRPRCPSFERVEGKCLRHASNLPRPRTCYFTHIPFTRCCRLQCVTAMNMNCQRSPKTEQFVTAKISGNALKRGSITHSVLRQRSS